MVLVNARDTLPRLPMPFTGRQWWAWFDAWEHVDLIELITIGEHPPPQLSRCPRPSDPVGFQTPPPLPAVPPCTCTYRIWTTRMVLPPIQRTRVRPRAYQVVSGTGFTINPRCEHHGDLRREQYFDATYTGPQPSIRGTHPTQPDGIAS